MIARDEARRVEILDLRAAGRTLREIGDRFGITASRVGQILKQPPPPAPPDPAPWFPSPGAPRLSDDAVRALFVSVDEIPVSVRAYNALRRYRLERVGDLARLSRRDLAGMRNVGKVTIAELEAVLAERGLAFGIAIPGWPPSLDDVDTLRRLLGIP